MLGSIPAEWAMGVPDEDLSLRLEPLRSAPFHMRFGPRLSLRYHRTLNNIAARRAGAPLPPMLDGNGRSEGGNDVTPDKVSDIVGIVDGIIVAVER